MISLKGKSIYNNQWFVAILAIVLFFINIRLIRILDGPFMFNDELGYLGNAAAFAGYDWHEIMQGCAWYSFGWSLILTPLFIVFDDMLIIYKSINVLNAILCVITFVLQYKLLTKCFCRLNNYYLALISFVTCCYPAVLINSSMAWSETWLLFMFVAITYFLLCMVNKPKLYKDIIWAFLLYYFYVCHNRMIGVLIAGILTYFIFLVVEGKVSIKRALIFTAGILVSYILFSYLKEFLIIHNWQKGLPRGNDFSTGLSAIIDLFSLEGICNFFRVFCCQLLYICMASYGFAFVGAYFLIQYIVKKLKAHEFREVIIPGWILLSTMAMVGISSIAMHLNIPSLRLDHIYYGRYAEPVWFLLISIGIAAVSNGLYCKINLKVYGGIVCTICIMSIVAFDTSLLLENPINNIPNISGLAGYFFWFDDIHYVIFAAAVISIFVFSMLSFCVKRKQGLKIGGLAVLCVFFLSFTFYAEKTIKTNQEHYEPILEISQELEKILKDEELPVYAKTSESYLQCRFIDRTIYYASNEITDIPDDKFYLFLEAKDIMSLLDVYYEKVIENSGYICVKVDRTKFSNDVEIPLSGISLLSNSYYDTDNGFINIGPTDNSELAIYGPYLHMGIGAYELEFKMECKTFNDSESLGVISVRTESGQNILGEKEIVSEELSADGSISISMPILIEKEINDCEFYLYTVEGVSYKILSISCNRNSMQIDSEEELTPTLEYTITSEQFVGSGFGGIEQNLFSWTTNNKSEILCYLDSEDYMATLLLGAQLPLDEMDIDNYVIDVYINGKFLTNLEINKYNSGKQLNFYVPKEMLFRGYNVLAFESNTWSPSSYGIEDSRIIGFPFEKLEFALIE